MRNPSRAKGSSLIITLLVLVVLSTIVVAFMQSMSIERMTAKSSANTYQAQLAAEAGLSAAIEKIRGAATTNSVVAYDNQISDPSLRPLVFIALDAQGLPVATNSVATTNSTMLIGTNHTFQLASDNIKKASMYTLLNADGKTNGVYSYVVQDNGSKQSLLRFPNVNYRAYSTTLREVPLIDQNGAVLPTAASNSMNALAQPNPNWATNLLTPATFNQMAGTNLGVSEKWADTLNWAPLINREGGKKIDLRRLKFYLDSIGSGQGSTFATNPKSAVVEALLGRASSVDPVTAWGGGTLKWLLDTNGSNSGNYTLTEARQIAANLIDYLDEDLHPTTDNANAPTYMGVEGRFESDGTVTGHPYVNALGFGLIFNISGASGSVSFLNSTRVLLFWALVNPWSHETLPLNSSYTPEFDIEVQGQVIGGGSLGTDARNYFLLNLNERLSDGPTRLAKNSGSVFPTTPSGNSFANLYSMQPNNRQPPNITFSNVKFVVRKIRLKFRSTDNTESYVQVLDGLSSMPVDMNPSTFTLPSTVQSVGISANFNPGITKRGLFLNDDPRLNFRAASWTEGTITSDTYSANPPVSSPTVNVFGTMHATEGDGLQGMLADSRWYSQSTTTNHFFARSPAKISADPRVSVYNPQSSPTNLAVDSIAELGYLHTGRSWQTLNILKKIDSAVRQDYNLLDYVDAGTMPSSTNGTFGGSVSRVNGKINPNTATPQTLRGILTGFPNISEATIRSVIAEIATNAVMTTNYPYIGSANYGALVPLGQGIVNKFQREDIMRRIANVTTTHSDNFTIYSYGEARQGSKAVARANLAAVVELGRDASGNVTVKVIRRSWK